jgi:hypothetical protein
MMAAVVPGLGSPVIGSEAGSGAGELVACWEGRSAWASGSSLCCSISARVGGLGPVMLILRFRICICHAYGCEFRMYVSIEDERSTGGAIRQGALHAYIATLRPDALHEM